MAPLLVCALWHIDSFLIPTEGSRARIFTFTVSACRVCSHKIHLTTSSEPLAESGDLVRSLGLPPIPAWLVGHKPKRAARTLVSKKLS